MSSPIEEEQIFRREISPGHPFRGMFATMPTLQSLLSFHPEVFRRQLVGRCKIYNEVLGEFQKSKIWRPVYKEIGINQFTCPPEPDSIGKIATALAELDAELELRMEYQQKYLLEEIYEIRRRLNQVETFGMVNKTLFVRTSNLIILIIRLSLASSSLCHADMWAQAPCATLQTWRYRLSMCGIICLSTMIFARFMVVNPFISAGIGITTGYGLYKSFLKFQAFNITVECLGRMRVSAEALNPIEESELENLNSRIWRMIPWNLVDTVASPTQSSQPILKSSSGNEPNLLLEFPTPIAIPDALAF